LTFYETIKNRDTLCGDERTGNPLWCAGEYVLAAEAMALETEGNSRVRLI
jgi:hypothetical protein